MRPVILLVAFSVILLSCKKKGTTVTTTSTVDSVQAFCDCNVVMIDRMEFMNWDSMPDTADVYIYEKGNNFTSPITAFKGNWVGDDGYIEGMTIFLGDNKANEYKIVLRQHNKVYKLKDYSFNNDTADCNMLNDTFACYNSFSFSLNDSIISRPKYFGNPALSTTGVYKLELY